MGLIDQLRDNSMYKVVFLKQCPAFMYNDVTPEQFYRYLELPFVPFIGLTVNDKGFLGPVEQIRYVKSHDVFWCIVADDNRGENLSLQELCENLEDEGGWVRFTREARPWFWRS